MGKSAGGRRLWWDRKDIGLVFCTNLTVVKNAILIFKYQHNGHYFYGALLNAGRVGKVCKKELQPFKKINPPVVRSFLTTIYKSLSIFEGTQKGKKKNWINLYQN